MSIIEPMREYAYQLNYNDFLFLDGIIYYIIWIKSQEKNQKFTII